MSSPPLFILLCSGEHEKIQMAGMCASIAAVSERVVEVFVSMNAINVFKKNTPERRYHGGQFSELMLAKNAPDPMELFEGGKALGEMTIYACSMAMDVAELDLSDFDDGIIDAPGGLTKFLSDAEAGQLIVF